VSATADLARAQHDLANAKKDHKVAAEQSSDGE
jgi:hypothetical protein